MQSYSDSYFAPAADIALSSAEEVVPLIMDAVSPTSVIDVGCGIGAWLTVFQRAGVATIVGVDGGYHEHPYQLPRELFIAHDLMKPLVLPAHLPPKFDLAVSLEVAEHLPATAANTFVGMLTSLAPVVMFSAAVPHQGGRNHVNEQWPDYWARLFEQRGFAAVDLIRPRIWTNPRVAYYYAQNLLVFVETARLAQSSHLLPFVVSADDGSLARIHPRKWLSANDHRRQSLRKVLKALPYAVSRAFKRRSKHT